MSDRESKSKAKKRRLGLTSTKTEPDSDRDESSFAKIKRENENKLVRAPSRNNSQIVEVDDERLPPTPPAIQDTKKLYPLVINILNKHGRIHDIVFVKQPSELCYRCKYFDMLFDNSTNGRF